jgi:4'-phosphopantetheinyl transferase EntD
MPQAPSPALAAASRGGPQARDDRLARVGVLAREELMLRSHGELRACLLTCESGSFQPARFEQEGLLRPACIVRSVPARQAEFFFGRLAARLALTQLGLPALDVPIGPSRQPVWPGGVIGSLTHSGALAAAAVAHRGGLGGMGIDIEHVPDAAGLDAIAAIALDAHESRLVRQWQQSGLRSALGTTLIFSAKECLFKAAFAAVGRYFDFSAVRAVGLAPQEGLLTLEVVQGLSAEFPPRRLCRVGFQLLRHDAVFTDFVW